MTSKQIENLGYSIRRLRWTAIGDIRPDPEDTIHEGVHTQIRDLLRPTFASLHGHLKDLMYEELHRGLLVDPQVPHGPV